MRMRRVRAPSITPLGRAFQRLRGEADLTQRGFAKRVGGVTAAWVSGIENGGGGASTEMLEAVATAMNLDDGDRAALVAFGSRHSYRTRESSVQADQEGAVTLSD